MKAGTHASLREDDRSGKSWGVGRVSIKISKAPMAKCNRSYSITFKAVTSFSTGRESGNFI